MSVHNRRSLRGRGAAPNMRLKLTGGDRSKGNGAVCPGGHGLSSNTLAPASESPAAEARSVRRQHGFERKG
jgi:hypothetical protein